MNTKYSCGELCPYVWSENSPVAAHFATPTNFVTKVTKCVKFDALPAGFVIPHPLSRRGDKSCRKVHSLHVLSPLHPNTIIFLLPSMCVCVCACACVCVCCVVFLLSPRQSVLNWNSVLFSVDHQSPAACRSVSCVKQAIWQYRLGDCAVWSCDVYNCMSCSHVWWNDWCDLMRLQLNVDWRCVWWLSFCQNFYCTAPSKV